MTKKDRPYNIAVGARIRARRQELGLSLERVAEHLHVNRSNVRRYETGESGIEVETLVAFGKCLGCKPEYFLEGIKKESIG